MWEENGWTDCGCGGGDREVFYECGGENVYRGTWNRRVREQDVNGGGKDVGFELGEAG